MAKKPTFISPPSAFKKREEMTHADKLYNKRHDPQWHRELVESITEHPPNKFSEKEQEFVESVDRQLGRGKELTDAQIDWLDDIYGRVD